MFMVLSFTLFIFSSYASQFYECEYTVNILEETESYIKLKQAKPNKLLHCSKEKVFQIPIKQIDSNLKGLKPNKEYIIIMTHYSAMGANGFVEAIKWKLKTSKKNTK